MMTLKKEHFLTCSSLKAMPLVRVVVTLKYKGWLTGISLDVTKRYQIFLVGVVFVITMYVAELVFFCLL